MQPTCSQHCSVFSLVCRPATFSRFHPKCSICSCLAHFPFTVCHQQAGGCLLTCTINTSQLFTSEAKQSGVTEYTNLWSNIPHPPYTLGLALTLNNGHLTRFSVSQGASFHLCNTPDGFTLPARPKRKQPLEPNVLSTVVSIRPPGPTSFQVPKKMLG